MQAYDISPHQHLSPLSAPASSPVTMHSSPQMHNSLVRAPSGHCNNLSVQSVWSITIPHLPQV